MVLCASTALRVNSAARVQGKEEFRRKIQTHQIAFAAHLGEQSHVVRVCKILLVVVVVGKMVGQPTLAIIIASDGRDVPVRRTGNPNSAILHRLPVGTLIPLAKEGTKEMKAVVADIDDNGEVIEVAWISRRNLKRIKMKQAYALKKMLPPR